MAQFQTEIQALRSLQHPNIIRLYDVYISPNHIFIVMELMEGGELFDYVVQKGTLTEEEASRIVRKVTSALVYMHSKNIIHRDMKPENLLLKHQPSPRMGGDLDLEVKIIDFGLSKVRSRCLHFTLVVRVFSIERTNELTRSYTISSSAWRNRLLAPFWEHGVIWLPKCCSGGNILEPWIPGRWG
jgi:serine/threonine protein kinase